MTRAVYHVDTHPTTPIRTVGNPTKRQLALGCLSSAVSQHGLRYAQRCYATDEPVTKKKQMPAVTTPTKKAKREM